MNDRELTEFAAKAAGYVGEWKYVEAYAGRTAGWYFVLADHTIFNPLVDDGDRYRLAKKLDIRIHFGPQYVTFSVDGNGRVLMWPEDVINDVYAIVTAAAQQRGGTVK